MWKIIILMMMFSELLYAYDEKKCMDRTLLVVGGELLSSTQFTSSWGECSAIGTRETRNQFLQANLENIKRDAARGAGEYLHTLSSLYGCKSFSKRNLFYSELQKNYEHLFTEDPSNSAPIQKIENLMIMNPELQSCLAELG
jgi:hypothetical protein